MQFGKIREFSKPSFESDCLGLGPKHLWFRFETWASRTNSVVSSCSDHYCSVSGEAWRPREIFVWQLSSLIAECRHRAWLVAPTRRHSHRPRLRHTSLDIDGCALFAAKVHSRRSCSRRAFVLPIAHRPRISDFCRGSKASLARSRKLSRFSFSNTIINY